MIDKSMRPNYVMQGKVRNYLGKQKMVKAPKKWKSGPDKPETELAYITKAEKDLILKADIHGSLKKGPNIGPSGIMSLDSWGDRSGGQAGADVSRDTDRGGGGRPDPRTTYSYSPPAPSRDERVSPIQSIAMTGDISLAGKTQEEAQASVDRDNVMSQVDVGFQEALRKQNIEKPIVDAREDYISRQVKQPVTKKKTDVAKATGIELIDTKPKIDIKETAKKGLFNLGLDYTGKQIGINSINPYLMGLNVVRKLFKKDPIDPYESAKKLSTNLSLKNINLTPTKDRIIKQSIATGGDGLGAQQVVSGGGDVVTQKIKEFTGEKPEEKVTQQPTDTQRSQLLLILKQLQKYNNENRLNRQGQNLLMRLNSLLGQRTTGGSKFI